MVEDRATKNERWREWYAKNAAVRLTKQRRYALNLRETVIAAYGGKCVCCGETGFWFLALDHVNHDGNKQRAEVGKGLAIYRWAKANGYPPSLQILCHNCNMAKEWCGECPHKLTQSLIHSDAINEKYGRLEGLGQ